MSRMRLVLALAAVALCGAAYHFFENCGGQFDRFFGSLASLAPGTAPADDEEWTADTEPVRPLPPADPAREAIRIATFRLGGFDRRKLADRQVRDALVRLTVQFDLLALQDIRARNQGLLLELLHEVNETGADYDFAVSPHVSRESTEQYSAFLYNRASVEVDPAQVNTVHDPQGRFTRPPLVGAFRVRGPGPRQAFTFTLINAHVDPANRSEQELLGEVYRAVRDDGRGEDDVILLGDLELDEDDYELLDRTLGLSPAIMNTPTTVRGGWLTDNILLNLRATTEFTGRARVFDLMRELDRSLPEVLALSEHLPVWAEFTAREGGQPGASVAAGAAGSLAE